MGFYEKVKNWFWFFIYKFKKPEIHVYEASLSGNGSFVDIRYWISRPDILNAKVAAYLIDEGTGSRLNLMRIAKFGTIRTQYNKRNNTGVLLFDNRKGIVKSNSRVSLHLDTLVATNINVK